MADTNKNTVPDADILRETFADEQAKADFLRRTTKKDRAEADLQRNADASDGTTAALARSTRKEVASSADMDARLTASFSKTADIRRITHTGASYKADPGVSVTADLSETINSNLPKLATTAYVDEQVKKCITDSKELQDTLTSLKDIMTDDNVDRVITSLARYLPLTGGTITGDLEVLGKLKATIAMADRATTTEHATKADKAAKADKADVATVAENCQGNALTANKADYAARSKVSDSCTGNAATADVAKRAQSVDSVSWSTIVGAPTRYPADGGNADTAATAGSVEWKNVKNPPQFLTAVYWSDIQGVPPTVESATISWENVTGKPASMPADGGVADEAKSVDWENIKNKPAEKIVTWDEISQKPSIYLRADKIDWNLDVINKPAYYPTKSVTWEQVTGKPDLFPNQPVDFKDIINKPKAYPTTWTQISGKPENLVLASDKIAKAEHADKAEVALNIPTMDVGGNIWIQE